MGRYFPDPKVWIIKWCRFRSHLFALGFFQLMDTENIRAHCFMQTNHVPTWHKTPTLHTKTFLWINAHKRRCIDYFYAFAWINIEDKSQIKTKCNLTVGKPQSQTFMMLVTSSFWKFQIPASNDFHLRQYHSKPTHTNSWNVLSFGLLFFINSKWSVSAKFLLITYYFKMSGSTMWLWSWNQSGTFNSEQLWNSAEELFAETVSWCSDIVSTGHKSSPISAVTVYGSCPPAAGDFQTANSELLCSRRKFWLDWFLVHCSVV